MKGGTFRYFKFDSKQPKPVVEKDPDTDSWVVPSQGLFSFTFQKPISDAAQKIAMHAAATSHQRGSTGINIDPPAAAIPSNTRQSFFVGNTDKPIIHGGGHFHNTRKIGKLDADGAFSGTGQDAFSHGHGHPPMHHHRQSMAVPNFFEDASKGSARMRTNSGGSKMMKGHDVSRPRLESDSSTPKHDIPHAAPVADSDWQELANILKESRLQVSALRYPLLRSMFLSLITRDQQLRYIHACSKDMFFNAAQVSKLCEDRPEIASLIACALFPSIRGRSAQLLLLGNLKAGDVVAVSKAIRPFLWFQEGNITGRYNLNLGEPSDYAVAENCLLVNAWESEVNRLNARPDVSQRGNYEMLRNESHNEVPFTYSRDWTLPSSGQLRFDYSSIRRPAPGVSAMPEASWVTRYIRANSVGQPPIFVGVEAKLRAVRAISVHMYLSTTQFRNLILCFPEAGDSRQDFFCMLHTRVTDPAKLLGPELLYSKTIFDEADRADLLSRIGHLHLLNPLHPEGDNKDVNKPGEVKDVHKALISYSCNLLVHEERAVINFLVQLTVKEPGGKVVVLASNDKHTDKGVPASWADKGVPEEDVTLKCSYETNGNVNVAWRQSLAERYCVGMNSSIEKNT